MWAIMKNTTKPDTASRARTTETVADGPMIAVGVRFPAHDIERINARAAESRRRSSDWIRTQIAVFLDDLDRKDALAKAKGHATDKKGHVTDTKGPSRRTRRTTSSTAVSAA